MYKADVTSKRDFGIRECSVILYRCDVKTERHDTTADIDVSRDGHHKSPNSKIDKNVKEETVDSSRSEGASSSEDDMTPESDLCVGKLEKSMAIAERILDDVSKDLPTQPDYDNYYSKLLSRSPKRVRRESTPSLSSSANSSLDSLSPQRGASGTLLDGQVMLFGNYGSESDIGRSDVENEDLPQSVDDNISNPCIEESIIATLQDPVIELDSTMPNDLYDFRWSSFLSEPVTPISERREAFTADPGLTVKFQSPYEAFVKIWDENIMQRIVEATNLYAGRVINRLTIDNRLASNSLLRRWRDTDVDELYVFFAVTLALDMTIKPKSRDMWTEDGSAFDTPNFSKYFAYDRYVLLWNLLHFVDVSDDTPSRGSSRQQAKIDKIQPIVEHLNTKFSQLYVCRQNIALSDSLTSSPLADGGPFNKSAEDKTPNKSNIDSIELSETNSGYRWRFHIFKKKDESDPSMRSLVLRLVEGLEYKGYTIWADARYNSPVLSRRLKSLGFDIVGPIDLDHRYVPYELKRLKKSDMKREELRCYTSDDVDLVAWRDRIFVALTSTYHGAALAKNAGVSKPSVLSEYVSVDSACRQRRESLALNSTNQKMTKIWYKRMFKKLLDVSVNNCIILCRKSKPVLCDSDRQIKVRLINETMSKHFFQYLDVIGSTVVASEVGQKYKTIIAKETLDHFPTAIGEVANIALKRKCFVCRLNTHTQCAPCGAPLCVNCYEEYHSL